MVHSIRYTAHGRKLKSLIHKRIGTLGIFMFLSWQSLPGQEFSVEILVKNGEISQTLFVGLDPTATSDYDSQFDQFAPPPPPSGNFDARIRSSIDDFYTDIRSSDSLQTFRIFYSAGSATPQIHLSWQVHSLSSSTYRGSITDLYDGGYGPVDLMDVDSMDVSTTTGLLASGIQIMLIKESTSIIDCPKSPALFMLLPNYPNPFNPTTTIAFEITRSSQVLLMVFNERGEMLRTLIHNTLNAGRHQVAFDGSDLASGIYFYRLEADGFVSMRQMVLMK